MPAQACPNCAHQAPRWLQPISKFAAVDYFRCDACGHVWSVAKEGAREVRHVTPLDPPRSQSGPQA